MIFNIKNEKFSLYYESMSIIDNFKNNKNFSNIFLQIL